MKVRQLLEALYKKDKNEGLELARSIDLELANTAEIEPDCVHGIIQAFGHPEWVVRAEIFQLVLKHHHKIFPYISAYHETENADIQHWALQVTATLARDYLRRAEEVSGDMKDRSMSFVNSCIDRLRSIYPKVDQKNIMPLLASMGRIRYEPLIPFFIEQFDAKRWVYRNESCKALVLIGNPAVAVLKSLIQKGSRDQCYWAFKALGQILKEKSLEPFFKVVSSEENSEENRLYALSGIKQVGTKQAIPYLIKCLSLNMWSLRAQASHALSEFKEEVIEELFSGLESKDPTTRYWSLKTLSDVVTEKNLDQLRGFLKTGDQELRFHTINALAKIASYKSIELLCACFNDDAWLLRKHAADSMIPLGELVIKPLMERLNKNKEDEDTIFWSLQVLSSLKMEAVLPALYQFLESDLKDYRLFAVRAIGQIQCENAVHLLISGFANEFWIVRMECFKELQRYNGMTPYLHALTYLFDPSEDIRFWSQRLIKESSLMGLQRFCQELKGMEPSQALHLCRGLQDLQDNYLKDLFQSSNLSVATVQEYLKDPYKIKAGVTSPMSLSSDSESGLSPVAEPVMEGINYFHFDENDFVAYPVGLSKILQLTVQIGGSDLHLKVNEKPMARVKGKIRPLDLEPITANQIRELVRSSFPTIYLKRFCKMKQLDCSFCNPDGERFRVNMFLSHSGIEVAFRHIHARIPTFEELRLPTDVFEKVSNLENGLVLITGMTGAGKSSTLASIIGRINRRDQKHIISIEDPIEFVHKNAKSVISHRQLGEHVDSYPDGLTACLREDPDIVLVGEMRDPETIKAVLKLAGTGHLVFSTFHTSSAPQTIEQIIQFFAPEERHNICAQLSFCLKAVISQCLVDDLQMASRIPVFEILFANIAVKSLIREGKSDKLASVMETSASDGMMSRQQYVNRLLEMGVVSEEIAKQIAKI